jgi:hypothetical protein
MIRKLVLAASTVALIGGSMFAAVGQSGAAVTITAGPGSSLGCNNVASSVKVSPPLKDDWVKSEHSGDSNADVKGLPNTPFAPAAPEHVKAKGTGTGCSGSVAKQGATTLNITKVSLTMLDEAAHPTTDPGSCLGLADQATGTGDPSPARYTVTLKYTATGGKVLPTTISHAQIASGTGDFTVENGTVSGSFAGSTDMAIHAKPTTGTILLFASVLNRSDSATTGGVASSGHPGAWNVCEPSLKIKTGTKHSAKLVKPKGLKTIGIDAATSSIEGSR